MRAVQSRRKGKEEEEVEEDEKEEEEEEEEEEVEEEGRRRVPQPRNSRPNGRRGRFVMRHAARKIRSYDETKENYERCANVE